MIYSGDQCPRCPSGRMRTRNGKRGTFLGCSRYPACRHTEEYIGERPRSKKSSEIQRYSNEQLIKFFDDIITEMGERGIVPDEAYRYEPKQSEEDYLRYGDEEATPSDYV